MTILLVNGAGASAGALAEAYTLSGLDVISYTPSATTASDSWPALNTLVNNGTRVINFVATPSDNSAAPYLLNEFTYVVENSYDNSVPSEFSCVIDRPTSLAGQTASAIEQGYVTLMNHFLYETQAFGIQSPNESYAGITNAARGSAANLGSAANSCTSIYGKAPTFCW